MRPLIPLIWLVVAALAVAVTSCDVGDAQMQTVTVRGSEYRFDPADVTVQADQPVRLTLRNVGNIEHNWTIEGMENEINTGYVAAGQSATITFTIDEPGTYTIYCDVPGHRELGMVGELTVQ